MSVTAFGCDQAEAALFQELGDRLGVVPTTTAVPPTERSAGLAAGTRCISVGHKARIEGATLLALRRAGVRYISTRSIGVDHIDVEHARNLGIRVEKVSYSPDGVADYAVMLMLMAIRGVKPVIQRADTHDFRLAAMPGRELRDLTIGVVGTEVRLLALVVHYTALMDEDTSALAMAIGHRVRQERQRRQWTLDRLAEAAGVSRRMVVNVEQGATNPSVGTLLRISDALGVGLPALVEPPTSRPVQVTRRGEGATLWQGRTGGRGVLVAGTASPDVTELWEWVLRPEDERRSDPHSAGSRELLHVHGGVLTLEVGDEVHTLGPGDAAAFPGDVAHAYVNAGDVDTTFALAVFEPGVGP